MVSLSDYVGWARYWWIHPKIRWPTFTSWPKPTKRPNNYKHDEKDWRGLTSRWQ